MLRATDNPNNPLYNKGLVAEVRTRLSACLCLMVVAIGLMNADLTRVGVAYKASGLQVTLSRAHVSSVAADAVHLSECRALHHLAEQLPTKASSARASRSASSSTRQHQQPDTVCLVTSQVSKFLFGDGFAVAGGDNWRVRRRAVGPALHRAYLETMIERVFAPSGVHLNSKLEVRAQSHGAPTAAHAVISLNFSCGLLWQACENMSGDLHRVLSREQRLHARSGHIQELLDQSFHGLQTIMHCDGSEFALSSLRCCASSYRLCLVI